MPSTEPLRRIFNARERWQFVLGELHALGQDDAQVIEKPGLSGIGLRDEAQTNLTMRCSCSTTSCDWMHASSSTIARGELPRPADFCHIRRLFQSTMARKHIVLAQNSPNRGQA